MEKYYEYNKDLYQIFIDFQQAYDSIHRPSLWNILREFNIPEKLISLIKACYVNSKCVVKVGGKETEEFDVLSGLRQGCILSPVLFNLVMEKIVRGSLNLPGARLSTGNIGILAYADDVVMVAENMGEINNMFTPFQETASRAGLICNESKTAVMKMSRRVNRGNVQAGNLNLQYTDKFKYLGAIVTEGNNMETEISERIAAGNRCYHALSPIMRSRKVSRKTKLRTYNIVIRPTVLYACETWTLTKARKNKLEVFENNILRRILGPVFDRTTDEWRRRHNREIREQTGQLLLQCVARGRRARWAGHCVRMDQTRFPRLAMEGRVQGTRPLGRPRYRWSDGVASDIAQINPDLDWKETAQDRRTWRGVAKAVMGLQS